MPVKNIAHDNARKAFDAITEVKKKHSAAAKEYLSLVRGADSFIHQCGLLQTLAFYLAKAKEKEQHRLLTGHLLLRLGPEYLPDGDILKGYRRLIGKEDIELMKDTASVRRYLLWLKRYAEAMLDDEKQGKGGGADGKARDSRQPENPPA
jgi:CRISPR type III-B/RAMP module-associated protein Cmr5